MIFFLKVSETSSLYSPETQRSRRLKPKILVTKYEITERQMEIIKKLGKWCYFDVSMSD